MILEAESGVAERREEIEYRQKQPAARDGGAPRDLQVRLRSWRPFPHEVAALLYVVVGVFLLERLPVTYPREGLVIAASMPAAGFGVCTAVLLGVRELLRRRKGRPRELPPAVEALFLFRAIVVLFPVLSVHFLLKSFIWLVNPRTWDVFLWDLDRAVHLGLSPSLFLTGAFTGRGFLRFLDLVYSNVYFLLIVVSVPLLLLVRELNRRLAFLAAYAFVWMAGSVAYLAFPAWGPIFVFPDVFEDVLRYMPGTVSVQEVLFREIHSLVNAPLAPRILRFGCVAAFPSLHLAVVTLFAAASRPVSRAWFVANVVVVVLMLLGSVVTGYHYLVDGWAGIALGLGAFALGSRLFPATPGGVFPTLLQRP